MRFPTAPHPPLPRAPTRTLFTPPEPHPQTEYQPGSPCQPCPAGTAAAGAGAGGAACVPCAPGQFAPTAGSTQCQTCIAGTFSSNASAPPTQCSRCAAGTYSDVDGAGACTPCPANTYSAAQGAQAPSACAPCPSGGASEPGSPSVVFCVQSATAAAAAAAAAQTPWQRIQTYVVPVLSVRGAVVTYLAVGDRALAACAPGCHASFWRALAFFVGHTLGPLCALTCCCCCRARARDTFDGVAAGVLKRLADLEEDRRKSAAARSQLKLTAAPAPAVGEGPLHATANPLHAPHGGAGAPPAAAPRTQGVRHTDGEGDVWYVEVGGAEAVWELPEHGDVVEDAAA